LSTDERRTRLYDVSERSHRYDDQRIGGVGRRFIVEKLTVYDRSNPLSFLPSRRRKSRRTGTYGFYWIRARAHAYSVYVGKYRFVQIVDSDTMVCIIGEETSWTPSDEISSVRIWRTKPGVVKLKMLDYWQAIYPVKVVRACVADAIVPLLTSDLPKNFKSGATTQIQLSYSGKTLLTPVTNDRRRDLEKLINWPVWNEIHKEMTSKASITCRLVMRKKGAKN